MRLVVSLFVPVLMDGQELPVKWVIPVSVIHVKMEGLVRTSRHSLHAAVMGLGLAKPVILVLVILVHVAMVGHAQILQMAAPLHAPVLLGGLEKPVILLILVLAALAVVMVSVLDYLLAISVSASLVGMVSIVTLLIHVRQIHVPVTEFAKTMGQISLAFAVLALWDSCVMLKILVTATLA